MTTTPAALSEDRLKELRADVQDELIVEVDNEWNNERRRMRHDHVAAIDELLRLRSRPNEGMRTQADDIPTTEIVDGLRSVEAAVHANKWSGELVWIRRACRRLTGEDGFAALAPPAAHKSEPVHVDDNGNIFRSTRDVMFAPLSLSPAAVAPGQTEFTKGAVSVLKPQGTEETGNDRPAAPIYRGDQCPSCQTGVARRSGTSLRCANCGWSGPDAAIDEARGNP